MLLPVVMYRPPRPAEGDVWLTLLDVGQGLATVIETSGHVMIYDTGPRFSARFDAGHAVLLPFLQQRAFKAVDMLVIGHGDNDHIGGMQAVLDQVPVRRILSSIPTRIGQGAEQCRLGQSWRWDGVLFEVLHPDTATIQSGSKTSENNASCVVRVSSGQRHVLLTGDIEKQTEYLLLRNQSEDLSADVLVVPHHGSLTSSSPAFVRQVRPEIALMPSGYMNRYGFPKQAVLARYSGAGARILESGRDGAITVRLQPGMPIQLTTYRSQHRHFWQRR